MPEKARAVARELGLPYYETSVLTYYGVDELFENAIRAALCARRNQRFWMAGLKKVLQPALQVCLGIYVNHFQNKAANYVWFIIMSALMDIANI